MTSLDLKMLLNRGELAALTKTWIFFIRLMIFDKYRGTSKGFGMIALSSSE